MSRPLRIVHVTPYFAPAYGFGGPPRSLLALCRAQAAAGLDVEVFTTTANPGRALEAAPSGRTIDGVRARYFAVSPPQALLGAASMAAPLAAAMEAADVVHVHGLFNRTAWMAGRLARRAGAPMVVSPRGMLAPAALARHRWRKRAAWMVADRWTLRAALAWHATSSAEAAALAAHRPEARIVEIPHCVDLTPAGVDAEDARLSAGVPGGAPYVLFLGRIHPIKRLDLLAEAFTRVALQDPRVHLVIAGPDEGGHRAAVSPLFAPIGPRVHWRGEVDAAEKAGLLAGAAALVACSDAESFGMSIAEALASGVPVVATETCPWPELETERCGAWVPQRADAIAGALAALLAAPDEARARGARGRALVAGRCAPRVVGERWRDAYGAVVAEGTRLGRPAR